MSDECLDERTRAEDIILGSLGYGEDARIISVQPLASGGFQGSGRFSDGEVFEFSSEEDLSELEKWALSVLFEKKAA